MAPEQEIQIILIKNTYDGRPVKESLDDELFSDQIIDLIGKWRVYAGAIRDSDPGGKLVYNEWLFLVRNYGDITDQELNHLIDLYARHELPDIEYFNYPNFCASFMTEVILAYIKYKSVKLREILDRAKKKLELVAPVVDEEFRAESMRTMLRMVKESVVDDPNCNIYLNRGLINVAFDYLVRQKLIIFTPELTQSARSFAQDMDKKNVNLFARYYCLKHFFENSTISEINGLVKVRHFKNEDNGRKN